jgi:hypothetical protein
VTRPTERSSVLRGRSLIGAAVRRASIWGAALGIGSAIGSASVGEALTRFLVAFAFFGSLVFVSTPRRFAYDLAKRVTFEAASPATKAERRRINNQAASAIILGRSVTDDPALQKAVAERAGVVRETPALDRIAFWLPLCWIVIIVTLAAYRWRAADATTAGLTLFTLILPVISLLGRRLYHSNARRAERIYEASVAATSVDGGDEEPTDRSSD